MPAPAMAMERKVGILAQGHAKYAEYDESYCISPTTEDIKDGIAIDSNPCIEYGQ